MEQNAVTSFYLTPITDQGWQVKLGFFPKKKKNLSSQNALRTCRKHFFFYYNFPTSNQNKKVVAKLNFVVNYKFFFFRYFSKRSNLIWNFF